MDELFDLSRDSVALFLARWYGPPDLPGAVPEAAGRLPAPLRGWYEAVSRHSGPVTFHHTVLAADEVEVADGKLVFLLENQEVYEWAADPDGEDPLVFERPTVDGEPWYPTGVRLSAFLVSVAVFEAIQGAEHSRYEEELTAGQRAEALAGLRPLPMPGPTLDAQLYAGDGLLAFVGPTGDEEATWWLNLAADGPDRLP